MTFDRKSFIAKKIKEFSLVEIRSYDSEGGFTSHIGSLENCEEVNDFLKDALNEAITKTLEEVQSLILRWKKRRHLSKMREKVCGEIT